MTTKGILRVLFTHAFRASSVSIRRNTRKLSNTARLSAAGGGVLMSFLFGGVTLNAREKQGFGDEEEKIQLADFMAESITNLELLVKSPEMLHKMELMCLQLQAKLCRELEDIEGSTKFKVDRWLKCESNDTKRVRIGADNEERKCQQRVWDSAAFPMLLYDIEEPELFESSQGGGITCVMEDGAVFERAGVNISVVSGKLGPDAVRAMNSRGRDLPVDEEMAFHAVGISSVIHPRNPMVPTKHFNFRYFEVKPEISEKQWWFGGGADLTPYCLDEKDAKHFHCTYKTACELHGPTHYAKFKKWCDDYFYIKHRCMRRGVGGIFFDDFKLNSAEASFNFVKDNANAVMPSYIPIVLEHMNDPYTPQQREFQLMRRGHYAEFNLLYDRGTKFGFHTPGARYESILMSLPPKCSWVYCYEPERGTAEARLYEVLRNPVDWSEV